MSWVQYDETSQFPIQNLPYGIFFLKIQGSGSARAGVRIGDFVLDLGELENQGYFTEVFGEKSCVFGKPELNEFMGMGRPVWLAVREILTNLLSTDSPIKDDEDLKSKILFSVSDVSNLVPARVGDYTDFYSSKEHATNLGKMFRPNEAALKPNWVWLPVGYHGRASSVVTSGTPIRRPNGQVKPPTENEPHFSHCKRLDFELEMGFFVGPGNILGDPISIENSEDHIFGLVLMNDWSARDIQAWEYVPLGPFGAKNFGTTISPWIVTLEALEPFRVPSVPKDPPTLPYLTDDSPANYDIQLEVYIDNERLNEPVRVCESNHKYLYWSMKQQLTHHSITGCDMRPGDLLGSGTISGPEEGQAGAMIELTWNGKNPIELPNGETRGFIEDGDNVILRGWCQGEGYRVGFGDCAGVVLPAHPITY